MCKGLNTCSMICYCRYNQIATAAFQAKQDPQREPEQPHKHEEPLKVSHDGSTMKPAPTVSATRSASSSGSLEGVAQELYRTIFFLVFYTQVWLISNLPYVGECSALPCSSMMMFIFGILVGRGVGTIAVD